MIFRQTLTSLDYLFNLVISILLIITGKIKLSQFNILTFNFYAYVLP